MLRIIIALLCFIGIASAKIFYPGVEFRPPNVQLKQDNTTQWRQHVDSVITNGIFTLSQAFRRDISQTNLRNNELNVVFSPVCISEILALLLLGSNGVTKLEIAKVLGFATGIDLNEHSYLVHEEFGRLLKSLESFAQSEHDTTSVGTAIFAQQGLDISDDYIRAAKNIYNSEIMQNLDFIKNPSAAQNVINAWVRDKTQNMIPTILDAPPSTSNRMILVSTLYFNGKWLFPFTPGFLSRRPFYVNGVGNPTNVAVEYMGTGGDDFPYNEDAVLDCQIVALPYKGGSTVFYAILPRLSTKAKLEELQAKLTAETIQRLVSNMQPTRITLIFPKMHLTKTMSLKDPLKNLGMTSIFDPKHADLSAMFRYDNLQQRVQNGDNLYVDDVLHKVQIDVTESGTVASAATAVSLTKNKALNLRFNVPFLFLIRNENAKLDLFMGSVDLPEPHFKNDETKESTM